MRSTQFARPFSNWASHMPSSGSPLQTLGWSSMNRVVDLKWLSWNSWNLMPGHVMCSDRVFPCLLNLLRTDFDVCMYVYIYIRSYNIIYIIYGSLRKIFLSSHPVLPILPFVHRFLIINSAPRPSPLQKRRWKTQSPHLDWDPRKNSTGSTHLNTCKHSRYSFLELQAACVCQGVSEGRRCCGSDK